MNNREDAKTRRNSKCVGGGILLLCAVMNEAPPQFVDATTAAGIDFVHTTGASGQKYMIETMGSGAAFIDYDSDGDLDIFIVDSNTLPGYKSDKTPSHRLYRNNGDGTFSDSTQKAGVSGSSYGMGVAIGDYDNDGWDDIYVTNWGPGILYRNNGNGTFRDVTKTAGVGAGGWGTSCAFADYDADGDLDLFIGNYVDFKLERNKWCGRERPGERAYCTPEVYDGTPSLLYRNNGNGTFSDVTRQAGVDNPKGKALGVVWGDYNNDGRIDLLVANDTEPNFLYRNNGDGTFTDVALVAGVAYGENGKALSGMGVDFGDYDRDGFLDIFVTNLDFQYNSFFRNNGRQADGAYSGTFDSVITQTRTGPPSWLHSGFGAGFHDFDNDGWLDILVANGHVIDNIHLYREDVTYAERKLLFINLGNGSFVEAAAKSGKALMVPEVSRGAAFGDYDNDGDVDVFVTNNGSRATLLRNDGGNRNHWITIKTVGTKSNRNGIGARITLLAGGVKQMKEVKNSGSYCSAGDLRVHFGLGKAAMVESLEIRWPSGIVQKLANVKANQFLTVREGA
jgi:enediyne biosynthesis protein E4